MTEMDCGVAEIQVFMPAREMRRRDHDVVVITLKEQARTILPKFVESGIHSLDSQIKCST
jgi:hypothetical protein